MKKLLKILGFLFIAILVLGFVLKLVLDKPRPTGERGQEAELLAKKMLMAVDKAAWDSTRVLQWTFRGEHHYLWDKERNVAEIKWDDYRVLLRMDDVDGTVWKGEELLSGDAARKIVDQAWSYWCNDSFWFNPIVKIYDKGTSRSIVKQPDGSDALMVSYDSGGVTPGDSYLWILDKNGLPTSYKMWVSIIPIGGVEITWENWKTLSTGAKISTFHKAKAALEIPITNVKGATDFASFGIKDPWATTK